MICMDENELLSEGYRKYEGTGIDVYFNRSLCVHSARCVRGNREVFNVNRKPWIFPDGEKEAERLAKLINTCPSAALMYIIKPAKNVALKSGESRFYLVDDKGVEIAEMTYSKSGEGLIIIDHTNVDENHRGNGLGMKLFLKVIDMARQEGMKIIPECPYAKSVFEKSDVYDDVLRKA